MLRRRRRCLRSMNDVGAVAAAARSYLRCAHTHRRRNTHAHTHLSHVCVHWRRRRLLWLTNKMGRGLNRIRLFFLCFTAFFLMLPLLLSLSTSLPCDTCMCIAVCVCVCFGFSFYYVNYRKLSDVRVERVWASNFFFESLSLSPSLCQLTPPAHHHHRQHPQIEWVFFCAVWFLGENLTNCQVVYLFVYYMV